VDKIWLQHYPAGVPATIDPERYPSLVALMEEAFAKYRERPAYMLMGRTISFGDIDRLSTRLAAHLQARGIVKGDRVAIMLPNVLQYPIAVAGVLRAGAIVVNVNPLYTARELRHQLQDSGARALIVIENFAATAGQVLADTAVEHVIVASVGEMLGFPKGAIVDFMLRRVKKLIPAYSLPQAVRFRAALADGARRTLAPVALEPSDVAVLQYTGGTTGVAKGAMLLHRTVIASLLAAEAWMQPGLARKPISGQLTIVCALPLYHVFAFISCSLLALRAGALNILIPNPRDIGGMLATLKPHRINIFPAVNTLFNAVANHPAAADIDWSELVIANGGGTAVVEATAKKWLEVTGCPVVEGYGLSESCSGITCNPTDSDAFTGTIGMPLPNMDVRLLDEAGHEVAAGVPGEIALRGPQIMAGYWQRPEDTARSMTADGFFLTGDVGVVDARGFFRIVDRKKDMILVSGFNVYPNEIEAVAAGCPGVLECAAVGIRDAGSGEAVKLFVVRQDPQLTVAQVQAYLSSQLTGYKKPKQIEFIDDLPKSNVGKILRRELRDRETTAEPA
jgi:long-chain acyl-CoA synthetase